MDGHTKEHTKKLWSLCKLDNNLLVNWMVFAAKNSGFVFSNSGEFIKSNEYVAIALHLSDMNVVVPRYMLLILNRMTSLRKEVRTK
jgi:hypothetical protein